MLFEPAERDPGAAHDVVFAHQVERDLRVCFEVVGELDGPVGADLLDRPVDPVGAVAEEVENAGEPVDLTAESGEERDQPLVDGSAGAPFESFAVATDQPVGRREKLKVLPFLEGIQIPDQSVVSGDASTVERRSG